jgi:4-hydroxy-tetrahydrodipicolinate synthase
MGDGNIRFISTPEAAGSDLTAVERLRGAIPALVTPLHEDGSADGPGIERLVEHVLAGGVSGLLALGSTGETASLDEQTRRDVLRRVVESADGAVPVLAGVAQTTLRGARAEVEAAAGLGAMAALVVPPFYYPVDQRTVFEFYRRLASDSPLPILVYNIPQFTKVVIEPATLVALAGECAVVGIKDSSRDFEYFERVCLAMRPLPDFRIFTGSDTMLLPSLTMGASGTICGSANVAPALVADVYNTYQRGDLEAARERQDALIEVALALRSGVFPTAVKAALEIQGVCEAWPAPPLARLEPVAEASLRKQLEGWRLTQRLERATQRSSGGRTS